MHTDDHILQSFVAAKGPLPTIALDLGMTFIALVQWIDRNADLLAVAKRAMETHIAFLALRAEAAALVDLTQVSTSTTNEERKRKSASQLLRHSAKRLLTVVGAPPSPRSSGEKSPSEARGMRGGVIAPRVNPASLPNLVASGVPPVPTSSTTNPERELRAPCVPDPAASATSSLDASTPLALMPSSSSPPSPRPSGEKSLSTEGAKGMRGGAIAPNAAPLPNATPFSDHEIDVLMATLARHFDIDLSTINSELEPNAVASIAGPA